MAMSRPKTDPCMMALKPTMAATGRPFNVFMFGIPESAPSVATHANAPIEIGQMHGFLAGLLPFFEIFFLAHLCY